MTNYSILASVRTRGALGSWEPRWFPVRSADPTNAELDWFPLYSDRWELQNFVTIVPSYSGNHHPVCPEHTTFIKD